MKVELIFVVEEAQEGGYTAKALGERIFTEGETLAELKENIRESVLCHFDEEEMPKMIRLHVVQDILMAV